MVKGRITVTKEGKRHVHKDGKLDLTTDNTSKGTCCCCKPYTLASFTASDYATWNLSKYQVDGVAAPNRYWRLINNYTSYVPIQRGCVDEKGKLVGLPNSTNQHDDVQIHLVFLSRNRVPGRKHHSLSDRHGKRQPLQLHLRMTETLSHMPFLTYSTVGGFCFSHKPTMFRNESGNCITKSTTANRSVLKQDYRTI